MEKTVRLTYTGITETIGGRKNGVSDGMLDIRLSNAAPIRTGTNPEHLVAAAWSTSFASSLAQVARETGVKVSGKIKIHAEVDLFSEGNSLFFEVRFTIDLHCIEHDVALSLIQKAQSICPFAKATRGNVDVTFLLA
ncbi:organic hydroperoxide resistance protein [Rhizobium sp. Root708]|uniref:Ohr family peroxiredoxin n=1 Tax=Rhizobium sp. Root708 TaxID=1736592 RepID=UPI0006FB4288|nr:Ohr family peroxiredoxin [Rhizobium sp. Root708]KRB62089.1 organic hydroperoxide resistance protein [Rhizobium sp. Root708]